MHREQSLIERGRQYKSLQAGRGLAAILVVVHHAALFTGTIDFVAGHLGVEFFFVLSGLVIFMAHFDDLGRPDTLKSFAWKRFRRIYPVYWVVLLPQLAFILARKRSTNMYQRDPWVVVSNLVLMHLHSTGVTVTVAWTLFHEILFYAFFALLLLNRFFGAVAMSLWLLASLFFFHTQDGYWEFFFSPLHLIFALGMVAGWLMRRGSIPWPRSLVALGVLLFAWAAHVSNSLNTEGNGNNLLAGLGAMLVILGAVEFERSERLTVPAGLVLLGDASYSIYLLHYPFLYAVAPVTLRWSAGSSVSMVAWVVTLSSLSVILGLGFHRFIERPLLRSMPRPARTGVRHTNPRPV